NDVDKGPVILKRMVAVLPDDTLPKLEERVLSEEHLAYPEAVQLLVDGRVVVSDSEKACFVDLFSDNWDVNWLERQRSYIASLSSSKEII
ncbi:MAG: formyltransferase family protein, partial [Nitrososphaerales archaeon]